MSRSRCVELPDQLTTKRCVDETRAGTDIHKVRLGPGQLTSPGGAEYQLPHQAPAPASILLFHSVGSSGRFGFHQNSVRLAICEFTEAFPLSSL